MLKSKKGGDYEGWVLRLITKMEEMDYALSRKAWLDFATEKIEPLQGYSLTGSQVATLEEIRLMVLKIPEAMGATYETYSKLSGPKKARYRDKEGKWGRKGTWVSAAKMNTHLTELKASKMIKLGEF